MLATPRVAIMLVLAAALMAPVATAGPLDCVTVGIANFGQGLATLLLGLQHEIMVGLASSEPGSGLLLVAKIDPVSCSGVGVGAGNSANPEPFSTIDETTSWLPLP